ncbi:transmembrane protein 41 homolog isoform X2 [Anabrus simplex]|uniref:transmembrane protein 41 homolog isoform X2 n=1 Tax=Anabrus simplex TaxID=316456 RepID=UPI0035A2623D
MLPQWQAAAAAGPVGLVAVCVQSAGEELSRERVSIGNGLCADIPLYTSLREKIQYNSLFSRWTCCKRLKAVFIGGGVVIFHVISLSYIYTIFPAIDEGLKQHIKIPYNLEEAKNLGMVLEHYTEQYFLEVFLSVFFIYIFMQTFAIPGSIFLSMLCGYLFNYPLALILVCFCSATGASLCYLLSSVLGRYVAYKILSHRIPEWAIIEWHLRLSWPFKLEKLYINYLHLL